jgi:hypothetical protein
MKRFGKLELSVIAVGAMFSSFLFGIACSTSASAPSPNIVEEAHINVGGHFLMDTRAELYRVRDHNTGMVIYVVIRDFHTSISVVKPCQ